MPVGVKLKRPVNPILIRDRVKVVAEAIERTSGYGQFVSPGSHVYCEAIQVSSGNIADSSESSVIAEAYAPVVWSNQKMSSSHVFAEAYAFNNIWPIPPIPPPPEVGIDIYDEGVLLKEGATEIDFLGVGIEVKDGGENRADVYVPPPNYVSHWNTTDGINDALVPDIATSWRRISSPTTEGTPFYTGGQAWNYYYTTRTSPLSWTCNNQCSFIDDTTTFNIIIKNGAVPQVNVVDFTTAPITGNGNYSGSNCTVAITNWEVDETKFRANVTVTVNIELIFPNSGYFDIEIRHYDGLDGVFLKTQ